MKRRKAVAVVLAAGTAAAAAAVGVLPVGVAAAGAASAYLSTNFQGQLASSPDATLAPGGTLAAMVVRGTDGFIYLSRQFSNGWDDWYYLGAPPVGAIGDPAIISWAPGRLDVFVRGGDNRLWQTYQPSPDSFFSPWRKPVGDDGILASGPEVSSRGPGRLDVWVLGTDGAVYQRTYDGDWNIGWIGVGKPPTVGLTGEPSAASPVGSERVDLYARGSDQKLWSRSYDGRAWGPWRQPLGNDGVLASPPEAVATFGSGTTVFVRGNDDQLYAADFTPTTARSWVRQSEGGNPIRATPAAFTVSSVGPGFLFAQVTAVVRGIDDKAYTQVYQTVVS